jgi:sulfite exporter TauE/SafE
MEYNNNITIEIFNFFILGLFGGLGHCIPMCHPFVLYISSKFSLKKGYTSILIPQLLYNAGRIVTYIVLSIIISFIGDIVNAASSIVGIQKISSVLAGLLLVLYGASILFKRNILNTFEKKFTRLTPNFLEKLQVKNPFIFGLFLGLLPCGLLYGALISAFGLASISKSAIAMLSFGIGTSIPLITFSVIGSFFQKKYPLFNKLSALMLIVMGSYFIFEGIMF